MNETLKIFKENPIIRKQYKIHTILQTLNSDNIQEALNIITEYIKDSEEKKHEIINLIGRISETNYAQMKNYIKLLKLISLEPLSLKDIIQDNITIIFNLSFIYFAKNLIDEKIITRKQYYNYLHSENYIDYPNEGYYEKNEYNKINYYYIRKISDIIDKDDEIELKNILSKPGGDINYTFKQIPHTKIWANISLIQYAAFRGSVICFKYLKNKFADIFDNNEEMNIISCAVCGGNPEIIQILKDMGLEIKSSHLKYTIKYHRPKLFDYITSTFSIDKNDKKLILLCIYHNFLHGLFFFENACFQNILYAELPIDNPFYNFFYSNNYELFKQCCNLNLFKKNDFIKYKNYRCNMDYICRNGDIVLFKYIYSKFPNINNINSLLDDIIISRNINFIKYVFDNFEVDINTKGYQGYTPIHRAIELNDEKIIEFLLQNGGINFNLRTEYDEDILTTAIKKKSKKMIKYLINLPNYPINRMRDSYEINPLGNAICQGDIETVKLLLNHPNIKPNIYTFFNSQHHNFKTNHIELALDSKNQTIMELLLSHPLITLTEKEKDLIVKTFPSISKEIINNVKIRKPNKYDNLNDSYCEDDYLDYDEDSEEKKMNEENEKDFDRDSSDSY